MNVFANENFKLNWNFVNISNENETNDTKMSLVQFFYSEIYGLSSEKNNNYAQIKIEK